MLQQILDISKWETSVKQVNSHTALEVFHNCIAGADQIDDMRKQLLEHPEIVISDLLAILDKKEIEIKTLQLDADEIMNQKINKHENRQNIHPHAAAKQGASG